MNDKVIALIDMDCFYVQVTESNDQIEKKSNRKQIMYLRWRQEKSPHSRGFQLQLFRF